MRMLADRPNVAAKVSGLGMFDHDWTVESIRPFVLDTIETFGVERCMFASNFPVDRLPATTTRSGQASIGSPPISPTGERRKLFHDNALRFYRL